jgi:hypothetical protein
MNARGNMHGGYSMGGDAYGKTILLAVTAVGEFIIREASSC